MLKIKNVSAKNFMSVGNNTQAVNFDGCQLTLVLGHNLDMGGDGSRNGTGKTTIINALSYALYGDALTNIRKDNLINKTNGKGMIVTVEFEIEGRSYRIERGRRPNVLRLYVDGNDAFDQEQQGDSRETQKEIKNQILEKSQSNSVVTGKVKTFTDYGAFVDLGGIDGLLHITDISWKRINHPQEILKIGDEIDVKVLKFDEEKNRVSLGMKQLGDDPWV